MLTVVVLINPLLSSSANKTIPPPLVVGAMAIGKASSLVNSEGEPLIFSTKLGADPGGRLFVGVVFPLKKGAFPFPSSDDDDDEYEPGRGGAGGGG